MTQPRQWSAIWAEKHNRELLKKTVKWGKDTSEVVDLPMPVGHDSVLLAIDNQTDKSLTGTIAQLFHRFVIEGLDLLHFHQGHVGDFLQGREAFVD